MGELELPKHEGWLPSADGFPRPDWDYVWDWLENHLQESEYREAFELLTADWIGAICKAAGTKYRVHASNNFHLVSSENKRYTQAILRFAERALREIMGALQGIATDEGYGKHLIVTLGTYDMYCRYVLHYFADGSFVPPTGGMFIDRGYGHFILPQTDVSTAEPIIVHELTHACLKHLSLPTWIDEGIAVNMEAQVCGNPMRRPDNSELNEQRSFWNAETVQEFWSGASFYRTDEGQRLSYDLATYMIQALARDMESFGRFVTSAAYEDAGHAAALDAYGAELADCVSTILGDGEWEPNPSVWPTAEEEPAA